MFKIVLRIAVVCAVVGLALAGLGGGSETVAASNGGLSGRLNSIVDGNRLGAKAQLGVCIIDLDTGRFVMSHNADTALIPASNQKILTSAAALSTLGADYRFRTTLSLSGVRRGSVFDGDLLLTGVGDPNVSGRLHGGDVTRPLREMGRALDTLGISQITGSLYYDGRRFTGPRFHSDWPEDQRLKWYSAEVSALVLNDNCLTVTVSPTTPGNAAKISTAPETGWFTKTGSVATNSGRADPKVGMSRTGTDIKFWGNLSAYRGSYTNDITVADPDQWFAHVMVETLAANGIRVSGGVKPADATTDSMVWREIGAYESDLATQVVVCNQRSQNLYAECLYRNLAVATGGEGSFVGGGKAVEAWLAKRKIAAPGLVVSDGSGLARANRVSAGTLTRTLAVMHRSRDAAVFRASMAVSGESGTLEKRLGGADTRGRVLAKTGTIRAVSTLSGYVVAKSGKQYAFSVLVNNATGSARVFTDQLVTALVTGG